MLHFHSHGAFNEEIGHSFFFSLKLSTRKVRENVGEYVEEKNPEKKSEREKKIFLRKESLRQDSVNFLLTQFGRSTGRVNRNQHEDLKKLRMEVNVKRYALNAKANGCKSREINTEIREPLSHFIFTRRAHGHGRGRDR